MKAAAALVVLAMLLGGCSWTVTNSTMEFAPTFALTLPVIP